MPDATSITPLSRAKVVSVVLLVFALWTGALLVPSPAGKERLTLAVTMWPGAEPFIVAREAGELPASQVNLVEINWTSAAMRAVGNRVVDAAILSLDEVVRQTSLGYPLRVVLITDISQGADMLLARPGITQVEQLKGLRVGYEPRTAGATMLAAALRQAGLTMKDIHQVPLNPAETEEIIDELLLDAVVTSEPWRQNLRRLNLQPIYDSSRTGMDVVRVLVFHKDALEAHREAALALVRAHLHWMPRLAGLQTELEPILRREGVDRAGFERALQHIEIPDRQQNIRWLSGADAALSKRMEQMAARLAEDEGGIAAVTWSAIFDPTLVQEAQP